MPIIGGHTGPIQDCDFSPFHENCLATASTDGTVKIWMIPEEGIKENTKTCDADLRGHSKKVQMLKFHPTSEFTLASSCYAGCIKVWDIQNEHSQMSYDHLGSAPQSLEWNWDGSRIACITREKQMHILDPRVVGDAQKTSAHGGNKTQRMKWMGNTGNIISVGFSEYSER